LTKEKNVAIYKIAIFFPMKVSNSSGFSFTNNHPIISIQTPKSVVVKFNSENKTKLVLEKREENKKKN